MTGSQQLILAEGAGGAVAANYIEDVFSTYLYTGNGTSQTITTGIDLSTYGGLLWIKNRNTLTYNHILSDTTQPVSKFLYSNSTSALDTDSSYITARGTSGFTVGSGNPTNYSGLNFVSWTFRKQPKFFDVVTWTGDGNTSKTISHSLGSVPGCIITKSSSGVNNWQTYHRSLGNTQAVQLNLTNAASTNSGFWNNTSPTSTEFTVGTVENASGETYVAYLFAHDAGGFGLTGTDNVISCGSVSGSSTVNLGWEPQWLLVKYTAGAGQDWGIVDNMRGVPTPVSGNTPYATVLNPNLSNAESTSGLTEGPAIFNATGFRLNPDTTVAGTHIYIAIRRGPMKTPTTGTSVFNPSTWVGGSGKTTGFPLDSLWVNYLPGYSGNTEVYARLIKASSTTTQSNGGFLSTSSTAAEDTTNSGTLNWSNTGYGQPQGLSNIYYAFRRAPGFFDVVCYTGTGANASISHNLGVAPELIIVKRRNAIDIWPVYSQAVGNTQYLRLQGDNPAGTFNVWQNTNPTASVFYISNDTTVNTSGGTYVAYLFASCPGVSKVGSYTGTGALQTINCGFTGGARFVLIKRTDSTGDWFVYDSANGISSGNDPYILFNSAGAQVTGTNYVDTTSVGFQVTAAAPAGLNASGGSYIFLAIA